MPKDETRFKVLRNAGSARCAERAKSTSRLPLVHRRTQRDDHHDHHPASAHPRRPLACRARTGHPTLRIGTPNTRRRFLRLPYYAPEGRGAHALSGRRTRTTTLASWTTTQSSLTARTTHSLLTTNPSPTSLWRLLKSLARLQRLAVATLLDLQYPPSAALPATLLPQTK